MAFEEELEEANSAERSSSKTRIAPSSSSYDSITKDSALLQEDEMRLRLIGWVRFLMKSAGLVFEISF